METLKNIRQKLNDYVGQKIQVTAYKPRNVVLEYTGTLYEAYPSFFIVNIDLEEKPKSVDRICCSYQEVLVGDVELCFL